MAEIDPMLAMMKDFLQTPQGQQWAVTKLREALLQTEIACRKLKDANEISLEDLHKVYLCVASLHPVIFSFVEER